MIHVLFAALLSIVASQQVHYVKYKFPAEAVDVQNISTTSGAALIGGGPDCVPAFSWMVRNANGGDFLVLRASGDDDYNSFIYDLSIAIGSKLNSITTIVFNDRTPSYDPEILQIIDQAEAIFFAGGDQNKYIEYWSNSPVQELIQKKLQFVSVGGTSAGLAILGNFIYSAAEGSVYSDESLENPFNKYITIADRFLDIPYLNNIITDTHFEPRDRMGRMLAFMARIQTESKLSPIRGIGIDETTALLLDYTTGSAKIVGLNNAFLCESLQAPQVCEVDTPLTYQDVHCTRLEAQSGATFDLKNWSVLEGKGLQYVNSIVNGKYEKAVKPYGV